VCGIGPIGISATEDPDEIVALDADCVRYMPQGEMNPMGALGDEVVDKLESACVAGQTSFHATGIEPGWAAEVLPLTMSGLFQRIDSLLVWPTPRSPVSPSAHR
jgi:2,4-diaminopentanoate dehydrogenase